MGNDLVSGLAAQPKKPLCGDSEVPYATIKISCSIGECSFFLSYESRNGIDMSKKSSLYKNKRALAIMIFDGLEYVIADPLNSQGIKDVDKYYSWVLNFEIKLNKENFFKCLNEKLEVKLNYICDFGSYQAIYLADLSKAILHTHSIEEKFVFRKLNKEEKNPAVAGSIQSSINGAFLDDLIVLKLGNLPPNDQINLLNCIARTDSKFGAFYLDSKYFERILEKGWEEFELREEYLQWVIAHFDCCRRFYKNKNTADKDRYQPDAGLLSKMIEKVEKDENPKEIELRVIYELINFYQRDENGKLTIRLVDLGFVKDLDQFRFLLKYCELRGNTWNRWAPSESFYDLYEDWEDRKENIVQINNKIQEIIKSEKNGDLANFFVSRIHKSILKLGTLLFNYGEVLEPYLKNYIQELPKEFQDGIKFKESLEIPKDVFAECTRISVSFLHNYFFTPQFKLFTLESEIYDENMKFFLFFLY
jgi:hypothetical protein